MKEQRLSSLFPEDCDKIKASVVCDDGAEGTRNKAKLAVAKINGQLEFGFYDSRMHFKKLEDCPLHAPMINDVLVHLREMLVAHKIVPYDLLLQAGELKYVLITYSESANELLIRFVLRSKKSLPQLKNISIDLSEKYPHIKVITANIQSTHQAILEGEEEIVLTESDCITHYVDSHVIYQGPRSFFQTNSKIALQLYRQFQFELRTLPVSSLLDLYCGVGAFSFFAADSCSEVVGVEISDAAISYANKAKKINGVHGIEFIAMDAEVFLKNQKRRTFDAILVNPPRRGLNNSIIADLIRLSPSYLIYSSCNADTLHRDILELKSQYEIQSLQIFDMFPFTSHFETLAVLKCGAYCLDLTP